MDLGDRVVDYLTKDTNGVKVGHNPMHTICDISKYIDDLLFSTFSDWNIHLILCFVWCRILQEETGKNIHR